MAGRRRSHSSESAKRWTPASSFLPTPKTLLMANGRVRPFIEAKKGDHTFLSFADVICCHKDDAAQAKMVAKAFAFLHDFLPEGFTGQWSHIKGSDVMSILMSETKEMSTARHKATQNAQANFEFLEEWMRKGPSWRQAAGKAQADITAKKRGPNKAPTLYTPAALVALLIISYPEAKYRQWIGSLQIDWMMGPRDGIKVRDGFWKGLTEQDLGIFQTAEPHRSKVVLSADYTKLLGEDFVRAQKDTRRFPGWAHGLVQSRGSQLSDVNESSEGDGSNDSSSDADDAVMQASNNVTTRPRPSIEVAPAMRPFGAHLHPDETETSERDLQAWWTKTWEVSGKGAVFLFWCNHWVSKMDEAQWYEEQAIIRSLFMRSLRTLHSLNNAAPPEPAMADAFMLLDVEDGRARQLPTDDKAISSIGRLESLPLYAPFLQAKSELVRLAQDDSRRRNADQTFREQMGFFYELLTKGPFNMHLEHVVRLDTLRTRYLVDKAARLTSAEPCADELPSGDDGFMRQLKLTKWQIRALAVSKLDSEDGLTDWQLHLNRLRKTVKSIYRYSALPAPTGDGSPNADPDMQHAIHSLFGDIHTQFATLHGGGFADNTSHHDPPAGSVTPSPVAACIPNSSVSQATRPLGSQGPAAAAQGDKASVSSNSTVWNPFSSTSLKRPHSPDIRSIKSARLSGPTTQDVIDRLKQDTATSSKELQDELKLMVTCTQEELSEVIENECGWLGKQVAKAVEQTENNHFRLSKLEEQVGQASSEIEAKLQSVEKGMRAQFRNTLQEAETKTRALVEAVEARIVSQGEQTKAKVHELIDTVDAFRQTWAHRQEAAPSIGQQGYLTAQCPAPAGWDQNVYESTLIRAGWYYVACLGDPDITFVDDAFEGDAEVFERTMQMFPVLDRQHLLKALEHVHCQGYNRPFQQGAGRS